MPTYSNGAANECMYFYTGIVKWLSKCKFQHCRQFNQSKSLVLIVELKSGVLLFANVDLSI